MCIFVPENNNLTQKQLMDMNTVKSWSRTALTLGLLACVALLSACSSSSDSDDIAPYTPSAPKYSQEYLDYLSAGGLRSDAQALAELGAHQKLLTLLYMKMSSGDWEQELFSTYNFSDATVDRYWEVLGEALEQSGAYEEAISRLQAKGALGTATTRGWDNIPFYTAVKILGYLKVSGKACRAAIIGVVKQTGKDKDEAFLKKCYDDLDPARTRGTKDYKEWWEKLSRGDYDGDRACTIFGAIMSIPDFAFEAEKCGVSKSGAIRDTAVPMITSGVSLVLNLTGPTTVIAESAEIIGNVSDLVDNVKKGESVTTSVVKTVSSIAKTAYNHFGGAPVSGGNSFYGEILENAQKEGIIGAVGDMEDGMSKVMTGIFEAKDYMNMTPEQFMEELEKAKASFEDTDKQSPADLVIATDQQGEDIVIGVPGANGKTDLTIPGGKTMRITAIDPQGDKCSSEVKAPSGTTTTIKGSSTEKAQPEEDKAKVDYPVEFDPSEVELEAIGDYEVVTVITNYNHITAKSDPTWLHVSVNGRNLHIDADPNTATEARKGIITVSFSENGTEVLKTLQLPVTQLAEVVSDLSFIDFEKFYIYALEAIQVDHFNSWCYATEYILDTFKFAHNKLTITPVSDDEYLVSGSYHGNGIGQDAAPSPGYEIESAKPYGLHYEFSFSVVPANPSVLVEENNFALKNIQVKGYYKYAASLLSGTPGDHYEEFDFTFSETRADYEYANYGEEPGRECKQTMLAGGDFSTNSKLIWKYRYLEKVGTDGNELPIVESRAESHTWTSSSSISSSFDIILKW